MSLARVCALSAVLFAAAGCVTLHEAAIKQRLTQTRFFSREFKKPLAELDAWLMARHVDPALTWCELCLVSALTNPDQSRTYCLTSRDEQSCVIAQATPAGGTRFEPVKDGPPPSGTVVRALWTVVDSQTAATSEIVTEDELSAMATEEEERFVPRWSFVAGAKTGTVVSYDPPTFTFGGQLGFRYWGSLFVVPGAVVEVESMLQGGRALATAGAQGRIELSLWSDDNARFFNLPRLTFLMSGGPLVAFGQKAALGGRAVLGLHLGHLGRFLTPFFFELGFQALEVDEQSATGLRIAVGLGF